MTLEEIAAGIEEHYREWATEHIEELDRVTKTPEIARRMVNFAQEAAKHPGSRAGKPADAVKHCMKLTALSNFRLGLLVGALLWQPKEAEPPLLLKPQERLGTIQRRCEKCETTGQVCLHCGYSRYDCQCGLGEFSPVTCYECAGEGYLPNQ